MGNPVWPVSAGRGVKSRNASGSGAGIGDGLVELEDEHLGVGMEGATGGGLGFFHGISGEKVSEFGDEARGGESFFDVVALEIDIGIDFVGDAVVALIAFESDIVSGGADPQRCTLDLERSFPYAPVI